MVIGVGIDLIEVARIKAMIRRHGKKFLTRVFTPGEQAYCERSKRSAEHFAARFAAKEAVMKALGTGLAQGINWTDIEVAHDADGRPIVILHYAAAAIAQRLRIAVMRLSLTHLASVAGAVVIAEGGETDRASVGLIKRAVNSTTLVRVSQSVGSQAPATQEVLQRKKPKPRRDNPQPRKRAVSRRNARRKRSS